MSHQTLDIVMTCITIKTMIQNFKHKGLGLFFTASDYRGIPAQYASRIERILDRLDAATKAEDMNLAGFKFHGLSGDRKGTFAVSVTGNWRITFKFEGDNAIDVELEDYH
jgi:proteic killer suppression protein